MSSFVGSVCARAERFAPSPDPANSAPGKRSATQRRHARCFFIPKSITRSFQARAAVVVAAGTRSAWRFLGNDCIDDGIQLAPFLDVKGMKVWQTEQLGRCANFWNFRQRPVEEH